MNSARLKLLIINLVGGLSVLGSYVYGLEGHPETRGQIWGGIPDSLQPLYTVSMFLAAAGYFAFTYFIFFRLDPERSQLGSSKGLGRFNLLYVLILLPSALWLPLTFEMIEAPSRALWWSICIVLWVVGAASLALLAAIVKVRSPGADRVRWVGIVGCVLFSIQTALLDALVWPAYYPF